MKRFLVSQPIAQGTKQILSPDESKHCIRVMRLGVGDTILITDGKGLEAEARIVGTDNKEVEIQVISIRPEVKRGFSIVLFQVPLKGPRMDWLIEKATELGVDAIQVLESEFSIAGSGRKERWDRIAHSAMKQSGTLRAPEILEAIPLDKALQRLPNDFSGFLLSPNAPLGLADAIQGELSTGSTRFVLAIGPEGGFSRKEEESFQSKGFQPCRLSSQILRGETAAISALSIALHSLELGPASKL